MGIISWIILGLIAGALGKFIMPGKDGGGCLVTCILGIVGALLGGYLGYAIGALLAGITALMYLTRRIDWYGAGIVAGSAAGRISP